MKIKKERRLYVINTNEKKRRATKGTYSGINRASRKFLFDGLLQTLPLHIGCIAFGLKLSHSISRKTILIFGTPSRLTFFQDAI